MSVLYYDPILSTRTINYSVSKLVLSAVTLSLVARRVAVFVTALPDTIFDVVMVISAVSVPPSAVARSEVDLVESLATALGLDALAFT